MKNIHLLFLVILMDCLAASDMQAQITPQDAVSHMYRGINIGNTMDCPTEGSWGNGLIQQIYFDDYKNAGFTSVRIPITWDAHTATTSPYAINLTWMARVKQVVDWGLARGLFITINAHHEAWLKNNYVDVNQRNRFDSIWSQISEVFKNESDSLIFEIINEPKGLTQVQINDLNHRILTIIRQKNPTRLVIFSGNEWANSDQLVTAAVPDTADHFLIGYYHSYDPYPFGLEGPGTYGSVSDINTTIAKFNQVSNWSTAHHIPVILSEFGAQKRCEYNSRMIYYATVVEQALNHNVAFNVWDDGGDFQIFLRNQNQWNDIKDILIYTYKESPTKLKATVSTGKIVNLTWNNRTTENDSILIDRKTLSTNFSLLAKIGHDADQYIDSSATAYDTVFYRLRTRLKDSIDLYSYPVKVPVVEPVVNLSKFISGTEGPEIYPNPAREGITILLKGSPYAVLNVFDVSGKLISVQTMNKNSNTLNISGLNKGAYFFKITSEENIFIKSVLIL